MKFVLICLLFVSQLMAENIMVEIGNGRTIEEAKEKALEAMSNNFLTEVKSSVKLESLNDKNFNYNFGLKNTSIQSNMILKDVKFKILSEKNGYEVKAIFDRNSLNKSINFLLLKTDIDYSNLTRTKEFELQRNYLKILSAFHPYLHSATKRQKIRSYILNKNDHLNKVQNLGSVLIYFNNANTDKVFIYIDNTAYPANQKIYLPYGKHFYLIKGEGYFEKKDFFFVNKKTDLIINVSLQKKHNKSFLYKINENVYSSHILNLFETQNLPVTNDLDSKNYFNIAVNISDEGKKIYGTNVYSMVIEIEGYVDDKLVLKEKFSKNNVFSTMAKKFLDKSIKEYIDGFYLNLENNIK